MANTENIEAKLCAYVDGELDPAGRAEIEAHLTANPQHRQLMDELMRQRELLASLPRERAPEDLFESMTNQLERSVLLDGDAAGGAGATGAGGGPAVAGRINQWPQVFAAAAVLLLAVGLAAVIYFVLPAQNQPGDYARVTPAPAASPSVNSGSRTRSIAGDPSTRPTEVAHVGGLANRVESKTGSAAKAGPTDTDTGASAAVTAPAPTAVAVGPTPSLPAAPAAAEPPSLDPFGKSLVVQAKPGASAPGLAGAGANMKNMFADAQINEKLKAAPGVPDNSMVVVVNSGNPSVVNQQIQDYFLNNGIKWEPVAESMPAPLDLQQSQTVYRSRLADTQGQLNGGPAPAPAPGPSDGAGSAFGGGFGGATGAGSAAKDAAVTPATPREGDAKEQREQSLAMADETSKLNMKKDGAPAQQQQPPQQDKQFDDRSKLSRPDEAASANGQAAAPAPPPAVVADAGADREMVQRRDATDAGAMSKAKGGGSAAGTSASGGQANKKVGAQTDRVAQSPNAAAGAAPDPAKSLGQVQAPGQPPPRDDLALSESSPEQRRLAAGRAPLAEQQQQQQRQEGALQQNGQQVQQPAQQQGQQLGMQQQMSQSQSQAQSQTSQVFIARGLTKQQVLAMNNAIANGNRVANYSRAGDTITPATLPSVDQTFTLHTTPAAQPAEALAKTERERDSARGYSRALESKPASPTTSAAPTGALGGTPQPTTAPTDPASLFFEEPDRAAAAAKPGASAPGPSNASTSAVASTAPATTQAAPPPLAAGAAAAEDLVDVVILVQGDDGAAIDQFGQQPAAPNAAIDGSAPTTATTTATTTPATDTAGGATAATSPAVNAPPASAAPARRAPPAPAPY